ncbi:hypothetical protein ACIA49_39010 [Kribbella sp. NPDC051587]|uniref:hypothetical protein n=1 Tax=Kribbella sp. NPDC051587 TaxID=3364119 RepID=UPI0037AA31B2
MSDERTTEARLADIEEALDVLLEPNTMTQKPSAWTALHEDPDQRASYLAYVADRWDWIRATYVGPLADSDSGGQAHTYMTVADAVCWRHHPAVVEEISALVAAWTEAYHRNSKPTSDPINWHDRWLPNCIDRISKYGIAKCVMEQVCTKTGAAYVDPEVTQVPA